MDNIKKQIDPRMHSAEHLLNQTMNRMFGCGRRFSAHIEKKKSKCDYHFGRMLTDDEIAEVEKAVNKVVSDNLSVTEEFLTRSEAAALFDLSRLADNQDDLLRIIRIGDYDSCPCIGPHVKFSGEIGCFIISSVSFESNMLRIRFKLL